VVSFLKTGYCSQTLFRTLNRAFDDPMIEEERASVPLAGGLMANGYQCGMVWGAALGAGAQAYRLFGPGPEAQTKAIVAAQRIVESFRAQNKSIDCFDIVGADWESASAAQTALFLLKGGPIRCFRMSAQYPPVAFHEINAVLSEERDEVITGPVGCAALLAQKMGVSDGHAVMAAGFAGGVGLSGSGCGALGAAIWFAGLKSLEEGAKKVPYKPKSSVEIVERFLKCTDYEFECSTIVGRKFEGVGDHADHMCNGGCSKIIETLAAG
jgi:hypothetical protein